MARTTLIGLNPDEYNNEGWSYYPFMVKLNRYNENSSTFNDPSGRACVVHKIKDIILNVFNILTRLNESKALPKHISCKCKY